MRYLIFAFVLLLLSIWLGLEMSRAAGYVFIAYRHWTIETSLWVAIIALVVLFIILYIIFRTLGRTTRLSRSLKRWRKMRQYRKGRRLTNLGLCELAEGNWERAEETLVRGSKLTKSPLINYLGAAQAANAEQAFDRRDNYLRRAYITTKGSRMAVDLMQAQLQMISNQWEQALATLQRVNHIDPHQRYALKLLKQVYLKLEDWVTLQELLPSLRKYKVESIEKLEELEQNVCLALLGRANLKGGQALMDCWHSFPKHLHHSIPLLRPYSRYLIDHHEDAKAIPLIESVLKKQWDASLVRTFSMAKGESIAKQLMMAESWLKKYPQEPELFLCVGRLSAQGKFWGKACDYLQTSIQLVSSAEAFYVLGDVYNALGDKEMALESYQKGLRLLTI